MLEAITSNGREKILPEDKELKGITKGKCIIEDRYTLAEAFNVANETGLTPRQLLKQRNELIEACKIALEKLDTIAAHIGCSTQGTDCDTLVSRQTLEQAIAKAETK